VEQVVELMAVTMMELLILVVAVVEELHLQCFQAMVVVE